MAPMDNTEGRGHPGPRRWLGIGIRLLATLFFLLLLLALNRCGLADLDQPTVTTPAEEAGKAWLVS